MNKLNTLITTIISFLGLSFMALIVFVSILGENHRIDFMVNGFFNDLKQRNYAPLCPMVGSEVTDSEACVNRLFFLELSLLSHFDLLERDDYSIVVKTDHFWIPFVSSDKVKVSIALTEKKKNMFQQWFSRNETKEMVRDFMWVERRQGRWDIVEIRTDDPALVSVINELSSTMAPDRYIRKTETGYALRENKIDVNTLSPEEKRFLEFSLFKISGRKTEKK